MSEMVMNFKTYTLITISHLCVGLVGFFAGMYFLPILSAPQSPSLSEVMLQKADAQFTGQFKKDLRGSDFFHWGEGGQVLPMKKK